MGSGRSQSFDSLKKRVVQWLDLSKTNMKILRNQVTLNRFRLIYQSTAPSSAPSGSNQYKELMEGPTLYPGAPENDAVNQLQALLGMTDRGPYGPKTKAAVIKFQTAMKAKEPYKSNPDFTIDGITGPATKAALSSKLNAAPATAAATQATQIELKGLNRTITQPVSEHTIRKESQFHPFLEDEHDDVAEQHGDDSFKLNKYYESHGELIITPDQSLRSGTVADLAEGEQHITSSPLTIHISEKETPTALEIADTVAEHRQLMTQISQTQGQARQAAINEAIILLNRVPADDTSRYPNLVVEPIVDISDLSDRYVKNGLLVTDGDFGQISRAAEDRVMTELTNRINPFEKFTLRNVSMSLRGAPDLQSLMAANYEEVMPITDFSFERMAGLAGGKNTDVETLQRALAVAGQLSGTSVDGLWGSGTRRSIEAGLAAFQASDPNFANASAQDYVDLLVRDLNDNEFLTASLEVDGANPTRAQVDTAMSYLGYNGSYIRTLRKFETDYPTIKTEEVFAALVDLHQQYIQAGNQIAADMAGLSFDGAAGKYTTTRMFHNERGGPGQLQYLDDWMKAYEDYFSSPAGYPEYEIVRAEEVGEMGEGQFVTRTSAHPIHNGHSIQPRKHTTYTHTDHYDQTDTYEVTTHYKDGQYQSAALTGVTRGTPTFSHTATTAKVRRWNRLLPGGEARNDLSYLLSEGKAYVRPSKGMIDKLYNIVPKQSHNNRGDIPQTLNYLSLQPTAYAIRLQQLRTWNERARKGFETKRFEVGHGRGEVASISGVWQKLERQHPDVHTEIQTAAAESINNRAYFRKGFAVAETKGQPDTMNYIEGGLLQPGEYGEITVEAGDVGAYLIKADGSMEWLVTPDQTRFPEGAQIPDGTENPEAYIRSYQMQQLIEKLDYSYTHTGKTGRPTGTRRIQGTDIIEHEMRRWLFVESKHYRTRRAVDHQGLIRCDYEQIGLAEQPSPYIPDGYNAINTYLPCGVLGVHCTQNHRQNPDQITVLPTVDEKRRDTFTPVIRQNDDDDDGPIKEPPVPPDDPRPEPEPEKDPDEVTPVVDPRGGPVKSDGASATEVE